MMSPKITQQATRLLHSITQHLRAARTAFARLSILKKTLSIAAGLLVLLTVSTLAAMHAPPAQLMPDVADLKQPQFVDRNGVILNITFDNPWNIHDHVPLYEIPPLLRHAFVRSEDQRFFEHSGVDWRARAHALWQNIIALRVVRGASTISEQTVRILHPRPRTLWSRWVEGFEAMRLEARFSKAEILEFYLNQVPYARKRRGIKQAARLYFDRELSTLNSREMLALVVLVRAPGRLDLMRNTGATDGPVMRLGLRLNHAGQLDTPEYTALRDTPLALSQSTLDFDAAHFIHYIKNNLDARASKRGRVHTTLDAELQQRVQDILDRRLKALATRKAGDGAVLIIDHERNEVLVWVRSGGFNADRPGAQIDVLTRPRQPGSTLKPFLYAQAIEKGWTAATIIDDSPLAQPVGRGLHSFHNYSRQYYGPLRLRDALANSLNIPAVRTMAHVGRAHFLRRLHDLGFKSLAAHPDYYGDGLALGNGEVTLLELTQAYAVLARNGLYRPVSLFRGQHRDAAARRVYTPETSSLIAHILSDPDARRLEFGRGTLLHLPVQTAVKTGTSSDYHDAWAMGFNHRYTVGVWMGNVDNTPMKEVSGSLGPALVLRAVYAELNRRHSARPLLLSPRLKQARICRVTGLLATRNSPSMVEWFRAGHAPKERCTLNHDASAVATQSKTRRDMRLLQPTPGLQMAMDPRIPDNKERFPMRLSQPVPGGRIEWIIDGKRVATTRGDDPQYLWPLARGAHTAQARVWLPQAKRPITTALIRFYVK